MAYPNDEQSLPINTATLGPSLTPMAKPIGLGATLNSDLHHDPLSIPGDLMGAAKSHIPTAISSHINPNARSAPQGQDPYLPDVTSSHPGNAMQVENTPIAPMPVLPASTGAKPITFDGQV